MALSFGPINTSAKYFLTDSRFLSDPKTSVFFAIKGIRHDGHRFINDLYNKGLREFVVEKSVLSIQPDLKTFLERDEIKVWVVENSIKALQALATQKRSTSSYPVVGVTGSNGKTIVKEWLSFLLEDTFDIVKSPRSYNSQIGVALSVWEMSEKNNQSSSLHYREQNRGNQENYADYYAGMDKSMRQKVALISSYLPQKGRVADMGAGSGSGLPVWGSRAWRWMIEAPASAASMLARWIPFDQ